MKTNYKVPSSHVIIFFWASLVGQHYLSFVTSLSITRVLFGSLMEGKSQDFINFIGWIAIVPLTFLLSWLIGFFLFKYYVPQQFEKRATEKCWLTKACKMIAPVEIIRMIICFPLRVPYMTAQLFAAIPVTMFDTVYLKWVGHYSAVHSRGILTFGDRLAFLVCFLLCEAIYIPVMLLIYRYWWKKTQKEREVRREQLEEETKRKRGEI